MILWVYNKFSEIKKNWLLLFYPNPPIGGSQQKPISLEVSAAAEI
jgi:hypothetical protein